MRKCRSAWQHTTRTRIMEAEKINQIGAQLADLGQRVFQLRGLL